jgi:hypothetical protein
MKLFINVNFYGHGESEISGKRDFETTGAKQAAKKIARDLKRAYQLKVVGDVLSEYDPLNNDDPGKPMVFILNYNAILGMPQEPRVKEMFAECQAAAANAKESRPIYLVTGFSAGGVTAIYFGREVNRADGNLFYLGLSDAAFEKNESTQLMTVPGVTATYPKNYYQTKGNADDVDEVHDQVAGFRNFNLDSQMVGTSIDDLHRQAVVIGNQRMADDLRWCVKNG